ncbi:SGNH/GDSL hydrolase family protein [Parafrigoribacterium mesophilum]
MRDSDGIPSTVSKLWPVIGVGDGYVTVLGADHAEQTPRGLVFHRLPKHALRRIHTEFFRVVEAQPSGVRLALWSRATQIELVVSTTALTLFPDEPVRSYGQFDLVVDGTLHSEFLVRTGGLRTADIVTNTSTVASAAPVTVLFSGLPDRDKFLEIWLPHDVEVVVQSLRADAPLAAFQDTRRTWLHYGSSISHGMNAQRPTGTWPAVAAVAAGVNLTNLGFSGNAMLDPFVATAIRDHGVDVISLKIGINIVNHDGFRARTFVPAVNSFLDTVRERHPETPIWVISSVLCPIVEDRPGPTTVVGEPGARHATTSGLPEDIVRGRLSLSLTRDLLEQIVASRSVDDPNLHYLDGRELYGRREFLSMPMRDGLHPDPEAQRHIGLRFAELVFGVAQGA